MSNIDKRETELLIENGVLVADTLRHLADNEIDSDYFAITSTNENGTEIDHELVITDYALQAAGTVDELVMALEAAEKRIAEQSAIVAAAEKLVRCKGRYHSELNYRSLAKLFGVNTPDLPPLEHENVHYADAAEMEIAALRQRINELEARTVTMPPKEHDNGTDSQIDINAGFANRMRQKCADAIRAAGIGVKVE